MSLTEKILDILPGTGNKKYRAIVGEGPRGEGRSRTIQFGDRRYEQYKDSTGLGLWTKKNHGDKTRRERYFLRHSGERSKRQAIAREIAKSDGKYNAKILSHKFLW